MDNKFRSVPVRSSEITSYSQYLSRRDFLKAAGIVTGSAFLAACAPTATETTVPASAMPDLPAKMDELGAPANSFQDITNYNNYYEFSTDKEAVNPLSKE
jgi:sulfoxide reductase catalytic subunit YedY